MLLLVRASRAIGNLYNCWCRQTIVLERNSFHRTSKFAGTRTNATSNFASPRNNFSCLASFRRVLLLGYLGLGGAKLRLGVLFHLSWVHVRALIHRAVNVILRDLHSNTLAVNILVVPGVLFDRPAKVCPVVVVQVTKEEKGPLTIRVHDDRDARLVMRCLVVKEFLQAVLEIVVAVQRLLIHVACVCLAGSSVMLGNRCVRAAWLADLHAIYEGVRRR